MVTNVTNPAEAVKNICYQQLPDILVTAAQPSGNKWFVEKAKQAHFYIEPTLRFECEAIFDRQGLKFSEGISRLVRLLINSPDELQPIILGQAPGNAALVLAREIIRRGGETPYETDGMTPPRPPGKGPKK